MNEMESSVREERERFVEFWQEEVERGSANWVWGTEREDGTVALTTNGKSGKLQGVRTKHGLLMLWGAEVGDVANVRGLILMGRAYYTVRERKRGVVMAKDDGELKKMMEEVDGMKEAAGRAVVMVKENEGKGGRGRWTKKR